MRETKGTGKVWASNVRHDWFGATVPAYCMVSGKNNRQRRRSWPKELGFFTQ